jgi:putative ABC transport system permease protein
MLVMLKLAEADKIETINAVEKFYKTFNPGYSFDYKFLEFDYDAQYASEQKISILMKYFAGLAVLISCLGLFGLASFTAERRIKEIGIRKTLGSSESSIVYLLIKDFTKIILISITIGLPVSYWIVNSWLDNFAYKAPLSLWYFIGAGTIALTSAWLTVSYKTIKAARMNPVKCLES